MLLHRCQEAIVGGEVVDPLLLLDARPAEVHPRQAVRGGDHRRLAGRVLLRPVDVRAAAVTAQWWVVVRVLLGEKCGADAAAAAASAETKYAASAGGSPPAITDTICRGDQTTGPEGAEQPGDAAERSHDRPSAAE